MIDVVKKKENRKGIYGALLRTVWRLNWPMSGRASHRTKNLVYLLRSWLQLRCVGTRIAYPEVGRRRSHERVSIASKGGEIGWDT